MIPTYTPIATPAVVEPALEPDVTNRQADLTAQSASQLQQFGNMLIERGIQKRDDEAVIYMNSKLNEADKFLDDEYNKAKQDIKFINDGHKGITDLVGKTAATFTEDALKNNPYPDKSDLFRQKLGSVANKYISTASEYELVSQSKYRLNVAESVIKLTETDARKTGEITPEAIANIEAVISAQIITDEEKKVLYDDAIAKITTAALYGSMSDSKKFNNLYETIKKQYGDTAAEEAKRQVQQYEEVNMKRKLADVLIDTGITDPEVAVDKVIAGTNPLIVDASMKVSLIGYAVEYLTKDAALDTQKQREANTTFRKIFIRLGAFHNDPDSIPLEVRNIHRDIFGDEDEWQGLSPAAKKYRVTLLAKQTMEEAYRNGSEYEANACKQYSGWYEAIVAGNEEYMKEQIIYGIYEGTITEMTDVLEYSANLRQFIKENLDKEVVAAGKECVEYLKGKFSEGTVGYTQISAIVDIAYKKATRISSINPKYSKAMCLRKMLIEDMTYDFNTGEWIPVSFLKTDAKRDIETLQKPNTAAKQKRVEKVAVKGINKDMAKTEEKIQEDYIGLTGKTGKEAKAWFDSLTEDQKNKLRDKYRAM